MPLLLAKKDESFGMLDCELAIAFYSLSLIVSLFTVMWRLLLLELLVFRLFFVFMLFRVAGFFSLMLKTML